MTRMKPVPAPSRVVAVLSPNGAANVSPGQRPGYRPAKCSPSPERAVQTPRMARGHVSRRDWPALSGLNSVLPPPPGALPQADMDQAVGLNLRPAPKSYSLPAQGRWMPACGNSPQPQRSSRCQPKDVGCQRGAMVPSPNGAADVSLGQWSPSPNGATNVSPGQRPGYRPAKCSPSPERAVQTPRMARGHVSRRDWPALSGLNSVLPPPPGALPQADMDQAVGLNLRPAPKSYSLPAQGRWMPACGNSPQPQRSSRCQPKDVGCQRGAMVPSPNGAADVSPGQRPGYRPAKYSPSPERAP